MLITTSADLARFCRDLQGAPYIAVDTEFMRERAYYARLCLVQVAHGEHAAAIDPFASIDMTPLKALLCDPGVVKVFHAASQDLEIFLHHTGQVPAPLFDTQIAAAFCGLGEQPGYAKLVSELLGIHIDKSSQATDWSLRPLTERQLTYALSDVTHLCVLYEQLLARLSELGRSGWVAEELAGLLDPARYVVDPTEAWRRIRIRRANSKTLAVLRELALWREEAAMVRDMPRTWIVRDDSLIEIARHTPETAEQLARVRNLKPQVAHGPDGKVMLTRIRRALASPESDWPQPDKAAAKLSGHEPMVALLQALLQQRCQLHGIAASLIATRADLDRLATETEPDIAALRGWRRELFGADALRLLAGELALTGRDGMVVAG
jgi:ribonuclease D